MGEAFKPNDIFHEWEILADIGAGLHGEVYRARHRFTGDLVALKVMHLEDARNASKIRRSLATATANYRIQCANVVKVLHIGCEEDGRVWIVMELLHGQSIQSLLGRQRGRMSVPLALHVAIDVAWGVDAAHELGIIHRDLKPDNVWLTAEGVVKVLDFSLAKVVPEGIQTSRRAGMGTVAYMAPESLKAGAEVDARTDVYALGVMLWQMIAGRHPFQDVLRSTSELIRRQLYVDPEPLSVAAALPAHVDEVLSRAIAKDPDRRFRTIAEMARALMTLRDRLREDAERGDFIVHVPGGEPPVPGNDAWKQRAYEPPRALPEHMTPLEAPAARVVVAGAAAKTQPLPANQVGLGGTLPLDARKPLLPPDRALQSAPQPRPMSTPKSAPRWTPMPAPSRPVATSSPRETPEPVERSEAPARRSARVPVIIGVLVIVSAIVASIATWRSGRTPHVAVPAPASGAVIAPPLVSATAIPEPVPTASASAPTMPVAASPAPAPSATAPTATSPRKPHAQPAQPVHPPAAPTFTAPPLASAPPPAPGRLFGAE